MVIAVFICLITFFSSLATEPEAIQFKPHERWWMVNVDKRLKDFEQWLGDANAPSRVLMRQYIKEKGYKNILDIPCGLCTEHDGYKQDGISIAYVGVDITPQLVSRACGRGVNAIQGSIEAIPFSDACVEVCYARHILEHLDYYERALCELIRVASKEVIVVFFMKPCAGNKDQFSDNLHDKNEALLYHNCYSREKLEKYIVEHPKVSAIAWQDLTKGEQALHIFLKQGD